MPMTPFHMLLAAPAKAALGDRFNVTAFVAANIAIDAPIVYAALVHGEVAHTPERLHAPVEAGIAMVLLWFALFRGARGAWLGLLLGSGSHLLLDWLMYPEMGGGFVNGHWLEAGCVVFGLAGAVVLGMRAPPGWFARTGFVTVWEAARGELGRISPAAIAGAVVLAGILMLAQGLVRLGY
ncbi:MAG: hypothetical protein ACOZAQ_05150 [Pseudomonadota bacterium]